MVKLAQLVRASDCGSEGRGFETHISPTKRRFRYRSLLFFIILHPTGPKGPTSPTPDAKKEAYRSKKEPPAINRCITHLLPEANLAHFLKRIYIISFPRRLSARIGQAPCCILLSKIPALSALACSARRTYKASFLIYQSLIAAVRAS